MRRFISLFFTLVIIFASVITVLSRSVYAEGELVLVSTSGLTQNVEVGDIFTVTAKAKNVADTEVYIWTTYGISAGSMATDNYFESPGSSSITSSSGKSAYVGSSMNNDNFNYTGTQLTLDPNETMTLVFKVKAVKAFDGTFNHGFNITYRPAGDSNKNFNIHGSDTDGTLNVDSSSSSSDSGSSNSSSSSSSSGSSSSSSSSSATTATSQKPEPKAAVASSEFPKEFTKEGSKTSDLSELTKKQSKEVKDFIIDKKDFGSVTFKEVMDLSSKDLKEKFNNLGDYVIIKKGSVEIKSQELEQFNKAAKIEMDNLNLNSALDIVILKDGKSAGDSVSNIEYKDGVLRFEVTGFSKYTVKPVLTMSSVPNETESETVTVKGNISDLDAAVTVSYRGVDKQVEVDQNGDFSHKVSLKKGANKFKVKGVGVSGEVVEETLIVKMVSSSIMDQLLDSVWILSIFAGILVVCLGVGGYFLYKKLKKNKKYKEDKNVKTPKI